eukprot:GHVR01176691.1.p1 GENE.GHVR01176691.1~~GHVR01176691.1.p1  ORF type:complete len:100 (-),score=0.39 GHVR01176691.1:133-432(-)
MHQHMAEFVQNDCRAQGLHNNLRLLLHVRHHAEHLSRRELLRHDGATPVQLPDHFFTITQPTRGLGSAVYNPFQASCIACAINCSCWLIGSASTDYRSL